MTLTASARPLPSLFGTTVTWDAHSLLIDGHRVCPVMGEIHYSRVPADEWAAEVRKMREGGVTLIATYVFWNHIEELENQFDWSGQRDLRRFLEVCKEEGMPVVLRMGPWCHGEVRNGGLPEWLFEQPVPLKMRSEDPRFLAYVTRLYRQIFTQVQGLLWKDGGPVIAAQFDNEYRGPASYLLALKHIALSIGFDLPFYTRTGWPELSTPMPFGEMLPLYGDYADGFWDKSTREGVGSYYKAFNFKGQVKPATNMGAPADPSPTPPVREGRAGALPYHKPEGSPPSQEGAGVGLYPYFTCELGGGMATAYHRRPYVYPEDAYAMALVKLGSGSNLLGYYMYHGGTNPEGKRHTLNECQTSPFTANNDLPVCTYDFQAPLGEFGQTYPHYYRLRPLHLFMHDFGERLAAMEAQFPMPQDLKQGDDTHLRWSLRTDGHSAFLFINNYERFADLSPKTATGLEACGVRFPKITIPAGTSAIFPVNVAGIRYATAQLVACREGKLYLMQIPGIPATIALQSGKTLKNAKPRGLAKPLYDNIYLLSQAEAEHLFLTKDIIFPSQGVSVAGGFPASTSLPSEDSTSLPSQGVSVAGGFPASTSLPSKDSTSLPSQGVSVAGGFPASTSLPFSKVQEPGPLRAITKGRAKVAAAPTEEDWQQAAVYRLALPTDSSFFILHSSFLHISYRGDCARLYADGRLIADNFYYGRPFLFGLWRLPAGTADLELRILPLQPDAPIYLPREADRTPGEEVIKVEVVKE